VNATRVRPSSLRVGGPVHGANYELARGPCRKSPVPRYIPISKEPVRDPAGVALVQPPSSSGRRLFASYPVPSAGGETVTVVGDPRQPHADAESAESAEKPAVLG